MLNHVPRCQLLLWDRRVPKQIAAEDPDQLSDMRERLMLTLDPGPLVEHGQHGAAGLAVAVHQLVQLSHGQRQDQIGHRLLSAPELREHRQVPVAEHFDYPIERSEYRGQFTTPKHDKKAELRQHGHLAMRGAAARVIQQLAGHSSLITTQRYMHLSPGASEAAIALLETPPARRDNTGHHVGIPGAGDMLETASRRPQHTP
jgi:hypothetical protein